MPIMDSPLVIAVDGGGTKCIVRLSDQNGRVLSQVQTGSANVASNFEVAKQNITDGITQAYAEAGRALNQSKGDIIGLALAGAESSDRVGELRDSLNFSQVVIRSDLEATLKGALGNEDGVVASIGTGSFFLSQQNGVYQRVGGWGLFLSDDCSGAALGKALMRYVANVHDGMLPSSPLVDKTFAKFNSEIRNLVNFSLQASPKDCAEFASDIVSAYQKGDPVARQLVRSSVSRLVEILEFLNAPKTGNLCMNGGLAAFYQSVMPESYKDTFAKPKGNVLDGITSIALNTSTGAL
ncbi:BadF/BadG/BcrA/BcrD ATPase family protein [Vibrio penaeicida]|uniref:BadF/BadG/BcrA/BcrD ATPase family protein n=1 Tax=Vibrio penaeicida TaxID=104609 RepID=UPI00273410A3|nr:BadF/BadG/BcrA/BcrD ATPase family protein [Vibrio penaeicida]MDP2571902.1 BadF/BadG/BcrA/BcrD ATPase family protein [Vibrio penaeicida]